MLPRRPKGFWYLPGLLYDLAFSGMFRGLRKCVARTVEKEGLYPWLDACSGTGAQLRGHVPRVRVPILGKPVFGLDLSFGFVRYAAARAPGVPFVCGDASRLPFKDGSLRAVSVSFGLHDKSPALQNAILQEARRVLGPEGRLIAADFEKPWDAKSRLGALFVRAIERLASREHYRNGREFLRRGGLRGLLRESGFVEVSRRDVEAGSFAIVVARPAR
jgi:demethylmenaquinone methyltransferase/2-methoxy-6-polyprenyl-1,4-benzoquinol methylase